MQEDDGNNLRKLSLLLLEYSTLEMTILSKIVIDRIVKIRNNMSVMNPSVKILIITAICLITMIAVLCIIIVNIGRRKKKRRKSLTDSFSDDGHYVIRNPIYECTSSNSSTTVSLLDNSVKKTCKKTINYLKKADSE